MHNTTKLFFDVFNKTMKKHFSLWCQGELSSCAIAGEAPCARALLQKLLHDDLPSTPALLSSELHGCEINANKYAKFFFHTAGGTLNNLKETQMIVKHGSAIKRVADDANKKIRASETSDVKELANFCRTNILPLMSNTQWTENMVKLASAVSAAERSEGTQSATAIAQNATDKDVNYHLQETMKNRTLRGYQFMTSEKIGECIYQKDGTIKAADCWRTWILMMPRSMIKSARQALWLIVWTASRLRLASVVW